MIMHGRNILKLAYPEVVGAGGCGGGGDRMGWRSGRDIWRVLMSTLGSSKYDCNFKSSNCCILAEIKRGVFGHCVLVELSCDKLTFLHSLLELGKDSA